MEQVMETPTSETEQEDPRRPLERQIAACLIMLAAEERALGKAWGGTEPLDKLCALTDALAEYPPHREVDGWKEAWRGARESDSALRPRSQVEAAAGLVAQIHSLAFFAVAEDALNIDSRDWSGPIAEGIEEIREISKRVLVALGRVLSQPGDELEVGVREAESAVAQ